MKKNLRIIAAAIALASSGTAHAALIYDYELNGSLANALGGANIVTEGGTLGPTGYSFAANQGLSIANASITNVYTIDIGFSFQTLSGYQKIIDFKDLASDAGLYTLNTSLSYFPNTSSPGLFTPNTIVAVRLSRNAAGLVQGYVNGALAISFDDSVNAPSNTAIFNPAVMRFFHDDNPTGQREAAAGFVDYIRVYDVANAVVGGAVPEPASWLTMIFGFGATGAALRRRRSPARAGRASLISS